jgi:hypothetical protein
MRGRLIIEIIQTKARIRDATFARNMADWHYEDHDFPRDGWKAEVSNGDTQLGYFDWVIHKLEDYLESK